MDQRGRWPRRPPRSNYPVRNEWLSYQYERSERIDADVELAEKISALEDKLKKQDEKLLALKNKVDDVTKNVKKATQKSNSEKSNVEKSNKENSNTAGHIDTSLPPESLEQGTTSPESLEDRLAGSLLKVLKILECAVCLEVVKIPFKECQRGHLICSECVESLQNCPTCQGAISSENPVCIKNLLEALPRPCPYIGTGCEEVIEPDSDMDHDVDHCKFRPVDCKICLKEISLYHLKEHILINHEKHTLHTACRSEQVLLKYNFNSEYNIPQFVMNHCFWLDVKSLNNTVEIKWHAYFVSKPTDDYFIKLNFEKCNIGSTLTLKASDPSSGGDDEETSSTKVFFNSLKHCINDEGDLVFGYEVFTKPK